MITASGNPFHKAGLPPVTALSPNMTVLDGGGATSRVRLLDRNLWVISAAQACVLTPLCGRGCCGHKAYMCVMHTHYFIAELPVK